MLNNTNLRCHELEVAEIINLIQTSLIWTNCSKPISGFLIKECIPSDLSDKHNNDHSRENNGRIMA